MCVEQGKPAPIPDEGSVVARGDHEASIDLSTGFFACSGVAPDDNFHVAWEIYQASFPSDERRSLDKQAEVLRDPRYDFSYHKARDGQVDGILAAWQLGDREFTFVEHVAVAPRLRSKGIGSQLVGDFIRDKTNVIVEVEPRYSGPDAQRRIAFYEKLGFHGNEFEYFQPPYESGKAAVKMTILSYPNALTVSQIETFKRLVYEQVYKVDPNVQYGRGRAQSTPRSLNGPPPILAAGLLTSLQAGSPSYE